MMRIYTVTALCVLGLLSNLGTHAAGISYKVYYAELEVEEGAVQNVSILLQTMSALNLTVNNTLLTVDQFNITTTCDIRGNKTVCICSQNYIWSSSVCDTHPECCNQIECYVTTFEPTPVCVPIQRVTVIGSATLMNESYSSAYANPASQEYLTFVNKILPVLQAEYSTFNGFDSLTISGLRQGSVIVDFTLTVNILINSTELEAKTKILQESLNATFKMTTTGIARINAPSNLVCYDSTQNISCIIGDPSFSSCSWLIYSGADIYNVVNGTEVTLSSPCKIALLKTSQIWDGTYNCSFTKGLVTHVASATLSVALLPEDIVILSEPQYPDCTYSPSTILVNVTCSIENSTENYNITWDPTKDTKNYSTITNGYKYNTLEVSVDCSTTPSITVTCQYTNRRSQERNASLLLPIIFSNTPVCSQDGDWPKAKDNTTAQLKCSQGQVGMRQRNCTNQVWQLEKNSCVNQDLNSVLQDTLLMLKGRGSVSELALSIFQRLKNSTNNTDIINTYANVNASVYVLLNMKEASDNFNGNAMNESILQDLVDSSSNLLDPSLIQVWNSTQLSGLPGQYLGSIEGLVLKTSVNESQELHRTSENVIFLSSSDEQKNNISAFNVSVNLSATKGTVKTIAFKSLSQLLQTTSDTAVNSILFSAIPENSDSKNGIKLTFPLFSSRPTNYKVYCVYWDFSNSKFSDSGCSWENNGVATEAVCVCEHLTSFATLMSKGPVVLPFLDEITYIGLGASVCSLIICIIIEFLVWNTVVKSNISHFRHTALVNISLCLLVADCCFLASNFVIGYNNWCPVMVLIKHFCYLAMFFWMLCLSMMLLHQLMFVFHQLRKKVYLTISIGIGYICPLLLVIFTYIAYSNGAAYTYYNPTTCWLMYQGTLKGSIHAFIVPVLTIVIINFLAMFVVITKLLRSQMSDGSKVDEKEITKSILKAVVFLTPVFGVTWILGFFVLTVDFTDGFLAAFINYAFTILNAFQGVLILLTGCFGEKKVRDAVLKYFISSPSAKSTKIESSTKVVSLKK